uniref:Uncharacterized protein n=1 Tax=Meloidogyne javanica TaxID=6303 RepID=A0A915LQL6_MELJA
MSKKDEMAPFYEYMCTSLKIPIDQALLDKLKEQNAKRLDEINKQLEDAEKNLVSFPMELDMKKHLHSDSPDTI